MMLHSTTLLSNDAHARRRTAAVGLDSVSVAFDDKVASELKINVP